MQISDEWNKGFDDAIDWCNQHYKPFKPMKLPERFQHRGCPWSKGFGEGLITGRNKIIDAAYPGNVGFTTDSQGTVTILYPEGHPALNKNNA